ncbi:MarR family winged helix-turn-helix transcriptional regulator [Modestobacter sp. SYSU DS0290]
MSRRTDGQDVPAEGKSHGTADDVEVHVTASAAYRVLMEVRPLYQAAERAVDLALQGTGVTVALRAVLELVLDRGPMTVPQVAREFGVTRQSVQALVDTGAARGLVELADNPQHRRSRLVAATEHGRRTFTDVHRRELTDLHHVTADLDAADLARCADVLAALTDRIRQLHHLDQEPT